MDTAGFDLELGRQIRGRLEEKGVTLTDAAERTSIPFSTLWRHLNRGGLTIPEVHALAEVLETSVSDLTALAVA